MLPWLTSKRRLRPGVQETDLRTTIGERLRAEGVLNALQIAAVYAVVAFLILLLRHDVTSLRPGSFSRADVFARTDFQHFSPDALLAARQRAESAEPNVYKALRDPWQEVGDALLALPHRVRALKFEQLDVDLASVLDAASLARLQDYAEGERAEQWAASVRSYVESLRKTQIVILPDARREEELSMGRRIAIESIGIRPANATFGVSMIDSIAQRLETPAREHFLGPLVPKVVRLTMLQLAGEPTHDLDEAATAAARNLASAKVDESAGVVQYRAGQKIVPTGIIRESDWSLLRAEHRAFRQSLGSARYLQYAGLFGLCVLITMVASAYIAAYQPRIVRNPARGLGLALLSLSMLLVSQLAAISSQPIHVFAVGSTVLVAMVLAIAYDRRFAIGLTAIQSALVTLAANAPIDFFLVLLTGSATVALSMNDLRSRSKLVEVGGLGGVVLAVGTLVAGLLSADPVRFVVTDALYAGAAGLGTGFLVLGALPVIERVFRITTPMTLLELADTSHPLLRKLSREAPGTYNHSMQVAVLCEEAATEIGADALLARVGAYYHDVGKMNKADYFVENQRPGDTNRHIALSPNVSKMIIIGHVKDGWELARQHNLPTSLFPFIRAHHGTTVVEYFYHRAMKQEEARGGESDDIAADEFRYPGPKPRSREVGILMLADAAESATRSLDDPNAGRITDIVERITWDRIRDGQFDESELTMSDIERVKQTLIRTLIGIHHPRIAYPSDEKHQDEEGRHESPGDASSRSSVG